VFTQKKPVVSILSKINPVRDFTSYFSKIYSNITVSSTPRFSK